MPKNPREFFSTIVKWYSASNRWWLPLVCGLFYSLCQPPFNHESHPALAFFPFISFIILVPLFIFSLEKPFKRALFKTYLFGIPASITQFYWIANVDIQGLFLLIMAALLILTLFIALVFPVYGMLFRFTKTRFGPLSMLLFPAVWILIEYGRSLGDMSFPWALLGYCLTPVLPLAQLASVTGVYGLSLIIVLANVLIFELLSAVYNNIRVKQRVIHCIVYCAFLCAIAVFGWFRLNKYPGFNNELRVSLIQNNIDQANWNGRVSFDTSMAVTGRLVYAAAKENPDLIVFPESGIYCYLERDMTAKHLLFQWADSLKVPMILGTLHYERESDNPYYSYRVYNSVFFLETGKKEFLRYHKIKLVPFSEALPFEGAFPVLSRLNLGESDFGRGKDEVIFSVGDKCRLAPFLCYEIIYPAFVRHRVKNGANLLVNLTNDGWWGRSNGPFQHAAMARMRSVENGVSLVRCANTGISMLVDPLGRIKGKTGLYTREVLTGDITCNKLGTFYCRFGDWIVQLSAILLIISFVKLLFDRYKTAKRRSKV